MFSSFIWNCNGALKYIITTIQCQKYCDPYECLNGSKRKQPPQVLHPSTLLFSWLLPLNATISQMELRITSAAKSRQLQYSQSHMVFLSPGLHSALISTECAAQPAEPEITLSHPPGKSHNVHFPF